MTQVFGPKANGRVNFFLYGLLVAVLAAGTLLGGAQQAAIGWAPALEQPVPFSHAHHVGEVGLDCRYCHGEVETSSFAGLPATEVCMTCHSQLFTDAPMLEPVRQSFASGDPLVWARVHRLPQYVYFNHSVHVANGVGCVSCHGRVDRMPLMHKAEPLTMQWCLDCHRDPGPSLRPESAITAMDWRPEGDRRKLADQLVAHYGIDTRTLTDCYVCHR